MFDKSPCRAVAGRGRMTKDGYEPENGAWTDDLCESVVVGPPDSSITRYIGRDPMELDLGLLTAAGHPPRNTAALVSALGDVPHGSIVRHKDIRGYCLTCAENSAEVRRCGIIDCPFWSYRMGRNPHNPRRGINPFAQQREAIK